MTLGDLIARLEAADPDRVVPLGFANPHSYRGWYDELAFEPAEHVPVRSMLEAARSALGATYHGYKGGAYTMTEHTSCHIAQRDETGEDLGEILLAYMLGDV